MSFERSKLGVVAVWRELWPFAALTLLMCGVSACSDKAGSNDTSTEMEDTGPPTDSHSGPDDTHAETGSDTETGEMDSSSPHTGDTAGLSRLNLNDSKMPRLVSPQRCWTSLRCGKGAVVGGAAVRPWWGKR